MVHLQLYQISLTEASEDSFALKVGSMSICDCCLSLGHFENVQIAE